MIAVQCSAEQLESERMNMEHALNELLKIG
jgi:hypothetical protein